MFGFFGRNTDATPPPTFKVFCEANKFDEARCLAVGDGALVLAAADPGDERQHWTKDVRYSRVIKDEEGNPVFSLVNKATGLAIQHSLGPGRPVRLARFYPDNYDESLLWTESADLRVAFGCIRMMHNVDVCLDAPLDGTAVVLSKARGDSRSEGQSWKTVPWSGEVCTDGFESLHTSRIYCKANSFSVTVRDGTVCLAPTDSSDKYQYWFKDTRPGDVIKDEDGCPAFALVNAVTLEAIAGEAAKGPLKLKLYNPNYLDESVLWAKSADMGDGFHCIHMVRNHSLNFDAFLANKDHDRVRDSTNIGLSRSFEGDNVKWKIAPWYLQECAGMELH